MKPLLGATDLEQWSDRCPSQGVLPLVIRQLVLATFPGAHVDFRAGDSVNRPGYDGVVVVGQGQSTQHIPSGQSVWEMGVGAEPGDKANADYKTRTENPLGVVPGDTTFVFVSSRRWPGKDKWVASKRANGTWRDVQALDADDLEQWLERCPAVAALARREISSMPEGLRDLGQAWEACASRTNPRLIPELLLSGRDEQAAVVRAWLSGAPRCLRVLAETTAEAEAYLAAVVQTLDEPSRDLTHARGLVVDTVEVWRAVAGQRSPLFLIAARPFGDEQQAVTRGHHVAVLYGNDAAGLSVDVRLAHLRRAGLRDSLLQMGLCEDEADTIAAESQGRISVVVDLLGGGMVPPRWAAPACAPEILPFFIAGSWGDRPGDMEAVARLARTTPDEVSRRLSQWRNETDPPVRFVGGMWQWVSRRRAWPHLSRHVTAADLSAFRETVEEVLGEPSPDFDRPSDQRRMPGLYGPPPRYSEQFREGLAGALVLFSAEPAANAGIDTVGLVAGVVRRLFGQSPDPRKWYSLATVLRQLAEASPDVFLDAVERDVLGNTAVREAVFAEEGMFGCGRQHYLLWALEILAWSPEHLVGAAVAIGELVVQGPSDRAGNKPFDSLRAIFVPWRPCTSATDAQRLSALDALRRRLPDVAFNLCLRLLPSRHDGKSPTARPRWRRWAANADDVTQDQYRESVARLFCRAIEWAREDQHLWARLLDPLPYMDQEGLGLLVSRLEALPLGRIAESEQDPLRRAVRRILHSNRTIPGIYPGLTDDLVERLTEVYRRLDPVDPITRVAWLFDPHPELLTVTGNDWRVEQEACDRERCAVVNAAIESQDLPQLLRLADRVREPGLVGACMGRSPLSDELVAQLLGENLTSGVEKRRRCASSLLWGRFRRDGWPWVDRTMATDVVMRWSVPLKVAFVTILPFETATWDRVEAMGEEVAAGYWQTAGGWVGDAERDVSRAVRTLLSRGRPYEAFHVAQLCVSTSQHRQWLSPDLCLDVLRSLTAVATGRASAMESVRLDDGAGHGIGNLISVVEDAGVASEDEIAGFEWAWLTALEHTNRGVAALHRLLAREPDLFVQSLRRLYNPCLPDTEGEDKVKPETDEATTVIATQAFRLLEGWHGVPGRTEDGIDIGALRRWVDSASQALNDSGHGVVGEQYIGQVLARVPSGADGIWPHESVRELLEELRSEQIERGMYIGVLNGRGATFRGAMDGGEMEQELAARYASTSQALSSYPRTARLLRRLSDNYRTDAHLEDNRRDLNEFLH